MDINLWAVLVCGIASMILGSIWYGPLFGKTWMKIIGAEGKSKEQMQKGMGLLYLTSFLLVLLEAYVLAHFILAWQDASGVTTALWLWAGLIIPTVAGASMWNNDSKSIAWSRFLVQGGYQLVLFIVFGLILGYWR